MPSPCAYVTTRWTGTRSGFRRKLWSSWPLCLWVRAGCSTTAGVRGARLPGSTARRWCGSRSDSPGYCWLKGWAYMVRTPDNQGLIAEIEGGIKKEVSVGCAVKRAVCSICGAERGQSCGHKPGEVYDGAQCFFQLEEAVDAYEFSFVAVPAQPRAGVVKGLCPTGEGAQTLRELAAGRDGCVRELEVLEREAALGRKWLSSLREEVVRLGTLADGSLDQNVLKQIADKLDAEELQALKGAYQARARERYPLPVQLEYAQKSEEEPREDGAFLI